MANLSSRGPSDTTVAEPIETSAPGKAAAKSIQRLRGLEIGADLLLQREAAVRAEGEGDERQAGCLQRGREFRRLAGIAADHRVGDLDAGIAAIGDRLEQVVGAAGKTVSEHFPGEGLAADFEVFHVHPFIP